MTKYVCVADLQTGDWCVGLAHTAEGWRRKALTWAESDSNEWAIQSLKSLRHKSADTIIEFISDYWQLEIVKENK